MTHAPAYAANNFTPLRLLLSLAVVLGHFKILGGTPSPDWPYVYAAASVDCFFVVSGYLIVGSWDRMPDGERFLLRRVFRIYPLYLAVVALQTIVLALMQPDLRAALGSLGRYFLFNAAFANFAAYDTVPPVLHGLPVPGLNPSLWTLKIEFGFYLIAPFLWRLTQRFGLGFLVALFAASAIYDIALDGLGEHLYAKQLPGQLQFFAVGMAGYRLRDRVRGVPPVLAAVLVAILAVLVTLLLTTELAVLYPLLIGDLVLLAALCLPPLRLSRDFSYGIYLLHGPLIQIALLSGLYRPDWIGLAVLLAILIPAALLAEIVVEMPGIALGRRLEGRVPWPWRPRLARPDGHA